MSRERKKSIKVNYLLVIGLFLIIISMMFLIQLNNLLKWTVSKFGDPAPGLNRTDILVYSFRLSMEQDKLLVPMNSSDTEKEFIVEIGESPQSITSRMEKDSLIHDAKAFRDFLIYSGMDTRIQAGNYTFKPGLNSVQIATVLMDSTPAEIKIGILPGWRTEEIAEGLISTGLNISGEEFLEAVKDTQYLKEINITGKTRSLEGFLFPTVYKVNRYCNVSELIELLITGFNSEVNDEMRANFSNQKLNLVQAVTLASMIQKEAVNEDEMPMIASVFNNRMAIGMKLESDPTAQYALGYNREQKTWWTNPLSSENLQVQSPYNTYFVGGLPPAPICNPGISALKAVAYPEKTDYLYFRAKCDGTGYHNFSKNFEEHISYECP